MDGYWDVFWFILKYGFVFVLGFNMSRKRIDYLAEDLKEANIELKELRNKSKTFSELIDELEIELKETALKKSDLAFKTIEQAEEISVQELRIKELEQTNSEQAEDIISLDKYRDIQKVDREIEKAQEKLAKIKNEQKSLKRSQTAIKNIINGYGEEYIISSHDLLDDLAEEFNHKEAGQKLKEARKHSKQIVKYKHAVESDHKDGYKKQIAMNFILDAFHGKVDSIFSRIKQDNFGKLEQEMKDAFELVNYNGKVFHNTRIMDQYLHAKQEELEWAFITNELKIAEREEQLQIKQAMREEEKARREIEKALRESEKEERMLQKAIAEANAKLAKAHDSQRQELEAKLLEMQQNLDEATAKNQRAISLAQQTKRGHVYVISNIGSFGEEIFKIGMTRRLEPLDRIKELGDASVPFSFDVHAILYTDDAPALEKELHHTFSERRVNKVNTRKEFFNVSLKEIKAAVDVHQIECHWTQIAEAKEYRESLAIDSQSNIQVA